MADNGSLAKYNAQRAAEAAAKRAAMGLPPRKKQKPYIDETMTPEAREYDRAVREGQRKREQSRKLRQQRCADLREHYKRRIEELCSRPFSWQQGN